MLLLFFPSLPLASSFRVGSGSVPSNPWEDKAAYAEGAVKLAEMFRENFKTYADGATEEILAAGPRG